MKSLKRQLNNQYEREEFVSAALRALPAGSRILDAGCGGQKYRKYCEHLQYRAQDFGQFTRDEKRMLGADDADAKAYEYGRLDYVGDIWNIDEAPQTFDAILCTEVFEHIPFPIETVKEFSRLLKPNGVLILTAPSNSIRHMDPYFFYTGFSDRWYQRILVENGFSIEQLDAQGDYYSWMTVELWRTGTTHSLFARLLLAPAFLYFFSKRKTTESVDTLPMGYHVVARKKS
jgi:SAM-dependent methyltransferase